MNQGYTLDAGLHQLATAVASKVSTLPAEHRCKSIESFVAVVESLMGALDTRQQELDMVSEGCPNFQDL